MPIFAMSLDFQPPIAGGSAHRSDTDTKYSGVIGPDFDLVCPACSSRCIGKTYARGVRSTYRNPYVGYCVNRIVCDSCGLVRELLDGEASIDHRYWFRIQLGENVLWAENEFRLRQIREVLTRDASQDPSALYALPKWLIRRQMAATAVRKIDQFLANTDERRIVDT
jgi:hypothetical protein